MLDKTRNKLINRAFQLAGITCPESMPTPNEMDDAAHSLNVMLQAWNNDGFRLFKIKTGYVPLISGKSEYKLATEGYKNIAKSKVVSFNRIGETKLKLSSLSGVFVGANIEVLNNTFSNPNTIASVDYTNSTVTLAQPMNMSVLAGNDVFVGSSFGFAKTTVKNYASSFDTIDFSDPTTSPVVGQFIYINYKNIWIKKTITVIDNIAKTIKFSPEISAGNVTKGFVVFGQLVEQTNLSTDAPISAKQLVVEGFDFTPDTIRLQTSDNMGDVLEVESTSDNKTLILSTPLSDSALTQLGEPFIDANRTTSYETRALWSDFSSFVASEEDWGSVTQVPAEYETDWGFVTDPVSVSEDYGNLSGGMDITSYAKGSLGEYITIASEDTLYLVYKASGGSWTEITSSITGTLSVNAKFMAYQGSVYLYDSLLGVYVFNETTATQVSSFATEDIVLFCSTFYLISPLASGSQTNRQIVSTSNFASFSTAYDVVLPSIANPVEFLGKMYIGSTDTFVSSDMKRFNNIGVYSDARSVVGDRLLNLNTEQVCSYTKDGVNFYPMPMMVSSQSAWGYKDGCSFIGVYGLVMDDGSLGTQIFTANDFNPVWVPQTTVHGKVTRITFDNSNAYFVSDMEVKSMELVVDVISEENFAYGLGEPIGRPQEVISIIKHKFDNFDELPMNAVALKDFVRMPKPNTKSEPVTYCFLKDAIDGKLMLWGTPYKFGEYLKMLYVEPITLLGEANSTPDFPDEYYSAVETALAAELGYLFGLPVERLQVLEAKATAAKEVAMLHDNEDLSYDFVPSER